jgi:hypothetical protein
MADQGALEPGHLDGGGEGAGRVAEAATEDGEGLDHASVQEFVGGGRHDRPSGTDIPYTDGIMYREAAGVKPRR